MINAKQIALRVMLCTGFITCCYDEIFRSIEKTKTGKKCAKIKNCAQNRKSDLTPNFKKGYNFGTDRNFSKLFWSKHINF